MNKIELTPKQMKKTESRMRSDAKLLDDGAEISPQGVLMVKDWTIRKATEEMEREFKEIKKKKQEKEEQDAIKARVLEALFSDEKRKLRKELAEKIQDPRDLYREEIIQDLILAKRLAEEEKIDSLEEFEKAMNAIRPGLIELRINEETGMNDIFRTSGISYDTAEIFRKIINGETDPKTIDIRLSQFYSLFRFAREFKFDPNNREDVERYIDTYGSDERDIKENFEKNKPAKPVALLKLDDGIYNTFENNYFGLPKMDSRFVTEVKEALARNDFEKYFELLTTISGCQDGFYRRYPIVEYVALKALEHDDSERVRIMGGCGDGGCGMSSHINILGKYVYGNGYEIVPEEMLRRVEEATGTKPGRY